MSVNIVKDRQTGKPRGIAFVEMSTQWEGRRAASMLNRTDFMGENLVVNPVRNSSGALNLAGIILKCNPAAEQRGIISNGVKEATEKRGFRGR